MIIEIVSKQISQIKEFFLTLLPVFFITGITKISLMGHVCSKTYEYYFSEIVFTPLDTELYIDYIIDKKSYSVVCTADHENFEYFLTYIKLFLKEEYMKETEAKYRKIAFAYSYDEDKKTVIDLTEKVRKYAGPRIDFYKYTPLETKKNVITKNDLIIILDDGSISIYSDEDEYVS